MKLPYYQINYGFKLHGNDTIVRRYNLIPAIKAYIGGCHWRDKMLNETSDETRVFIDWCYQDKKGKCLQSLELDDSLLQDYCISSIDSPIDVLAVEFIHANTNLLKKYYGSIPRE